MARKTITLAEAAAPEGMRIFAVGDIHGRLDLLGGLFHAIGAEIERDRPADHRIVFLGDYVDRGQDSAGVIDFLIRLTAEDERNVVLAGNHDLAFLDFLREPDPEGLFANFGGGATALSYGVEFDTSSRATFLASHAALADAVPAAHRTFLETLRFAAVFGDYFFCHAGVRPGVSLDEQSADDLAWIRNDFLRHRRPFAKVIVHGHTPAEAVEMRPNRINVDTGAYFSGRLSCVVLEGNEKRVIVATATDE